MKSPITAEMTMALMPCLLISTSAITWPAERLPPDNNAVVVDEGKDTTIGSMCKAKIELLVAFLGIKKNTQWVPFSLRGGERLLFQIVHDVENIIL